METEKKVLLLDLCTLKKRGYELTREYTLEDTLEDLKEECNRLKGLELDRFTKNIANIFCPNGESHENVKPTQEMMAKMWAYMSKEIKDVKRCAAESKESHI